MRIRSVGEIFKDPEKGYAFRMLLDRGPEARPVLMVLGPGEYDPDSPEPRQWEGMAGGTTDGIWLFRGTFIWIKESAAMSRSEVVLKVKHAVLGREKELRRILREVEAYENMERVANAKRERIPDFPIRCGCSCGSAMKESASVAAHPKS